MSVPKGRRKESQFEVFHHWSKLRREITDLLLRDFGYARHKAEKRLNHIFRDKSYEELSDQDKETYERFRNKYDAFDEWFVVEQRKAVMDCLRKISSCITSANSIYPSYYEELVERRVLQDEALAGCFDLLQELQYAIEVLPVNISVYTRFAEQIEAEVRLIKAWRQSDNRFKKLITASNFDSSKNTAARTVGDRNFPHQKSDFHHRSDTTGVTSVSAANFANVNNNGNSNYNNASNPNGVRPDFDNPTR